MFRKTISILIQGMFLFPAIAISQGTGFWIRGELTVDMAAMNLLSSVSENPELPFTVNVYREDSERIPEYVKRIRRGTFEELFPLSIPDTFFVMRALHDLGLISAKDLTVTREKLNNLRAQDGSPILKGIVITVTTKKKRYYYEMKEVDRLVAELQFNQALDLLDQIKVEYVPEGNEFIYRILQRWVEIIDAAFSHGKDLHEFQFRYVENFEEGGFAFNLSSTQKYKLLLQYIRALRKSHYKPTRRMATGQSISDMVGEAFTPCIDAFLDTGKDKKEATSIAMEYFGYLNDSEQYLKMVDIGGKYFDFVDFPEQNLMNYQREAVVKALVYMGDALASGTDMNSYTKTEYIDYHKDSTNVRESWNTYITFFNKWKYLFPKNSKKLISRRMRRYYEWGSTLLNS